MSSQERQPQQPMSAPNLRHAHQHSCKGAEVLSLTSFTAMKVCISQASAHGAPDLFTHSSVCTRATRRTKPRKKTTVSRVASRRLTSTGGCREPAPARFQQDKAVGWSAKHQQDCMRRSTEGAWETCSRAVRRCAPLPIENPGKVDQQAQVSAPSSERIAQDQQRPCSKTHEFQSKKAIVRAL